jgi:hypothetical protein
MKLDNKLKFLWQFYPHGRERAVLKAEALLGLGRFSVLELSAR